MWFSRLVTVGSTIGYHQNLTPLGWSAAPQSTLVQSTSLQHHQGSKQSNASPLTTYTFWSSCENGVKTWYPVASRSEIIYIWLNPIFFFFNFATVIQFKKLQCLHWMQVILRSAKGMWSGPSLIAIRKCKRKRVTISLFDWTNWLTLSQ